MAEWQSSAHNTIDNKKYKYIFDAGLNFEIKLHI